MPWVQAGALYAGVLAPRGLTGVRNPFDAERLMRVSRPDGRLLAEIVLQPGQIHELCLDKWHRNTGGSRISTFEEAMRAAAPEHVVLPLAPVLGDVVIEYWQDES